MNLPTLPRRSGFTLIELLVVIAIIAILASMLLTAIAVVKIKMKKTIAKKEMALIVTALNDYESAYNRFPTSSSAMGAAAAGNGDFTFGGTFNTPSGSTTVLSYPGLASNNSELMGVLLALEKFSDGSPTINVGHTKNPKKRPFLNPPTRASAINAHGLGPDGVYRDPWATPYVITVDLNSDDKARDAFYSDPRVSADPANPNAGLQGLIQRTVGPGTSVFECPQPIMIWSAGPDKTIDPNPGNVPNGKANKGANKDNILSW